MLADAAQVENGKLYVHGGGWDSISVASLPATHPSMALVLVFRVEYTEALQDIPIMVELLDADDNPMGIRLEGVMNVGHPARGTRGMPIFVPQAFSFHLIQFERADSYRFRVTSGERELASVPFRVIRTRPS